MDLTRTEPPPPTRAPAQPEPPSYESCEQCGAPVEAHQRYCVACGTRRNHVYDPAARFLATATSRARGSARATPAAGARRKPSPGLGTALVLAVIPLAVGLGLLLGRAGNGTDAKLLAALRAQKPDVVNVGGGASTSPVAATSSTQTPSLTSDFALPSGYAVELSTLSGQGTDQAAVTAAQNAAKAKGATAVGLISQSDFKVTPSPPAGDYVIYSGQYKARSDAEKAVAKLKKSFPAARVIAVQSSSRNRGSGQVLTATSSASFNSAAALTAPSKTRLAQGSQIAKQVSNKINSSYVDAQKGLPNQISVP